MKLKICWYIFWLR